MRKTYFYTLSIKPPLSDRYGTHTDFIEAESQESAFAQYAIRLIDIPLALEDVEVVLSFNKICVYIPITAEILEEAERSASNNRREYSKRVEAQGCVEYLNSIGYKAEVTEDSYISIEGIGLVSVVNDLSVSLHELKDDQIGAIVVQRSKEALEVVIDGFMRPLDLWNHKPNNQAEYFGISVDEMIKYLGKSETEPG
ncbi:hypothetical protein ACQ4M3_09685 [Leptolyngbya sp. AN03gr2]|uniref:hypothetical protein n=1 Tax=Leptolyngbya sp. AN03gr2 TaxID=3423364 RepID=UPI003D313405